ncbi:glycosyltransferase family 2 protein [Jeotgalibacillus sp. ET6]|uniref:glycosyltransferase family 2 protein n=1 Tax=Jeotgalibacillus sp. ET6 TaxID=3037260 RepID=UPI002418659B|nr:glycosyltransferase family 2 protein [Jeotgalibacillus sp. ET6]MDG5471365.1 glycosyltransferase family 2 protein [Jeotgalibacillus sp. ET6]
MCKVSVIIAAYNAEQYIKVAVESILNQTHQNLELIICDDYSTDNTVGIIKKLMDEDNRIVLLKNDKNMRAAVTRNKCLEVAQGEFIAIQDADDFSHPLRLEKQVNFLKKNNDYDFVSSRMFKFDENDDFNILLELSPNSSEFSYKLPYIESPKNKDFLFRLPYTHAATMFRSNAINSVHGYRVSKETVRGQDADLFMRLHAVGYKGFNLNESLYYYFEGKEAFKRKKYKYRIHSAIIRYRGFKALGLMPIGYIYIIKPLIVGIIPVGILQWYKK